MAAAIRLEDLLKAQAKLKEDEAKKQTTETMSVEEFRKMAAEVSDTTPGTTTKSLIKKGLTDKTGEGLNANVIKLTKVIKDATVKKGNIVGPAGTSIAAPADRTTQTTQDVEVARRARLEEQAGKYQMGAKGYLKDLFNVKQDLKGMDAFKSGIKNSFKNVFSLESWFDLSEGKSKGLMGQAVRRKVAQNQYVDKRMESEEKRMLNLPQYQGVEGRAKARKDLRAQFNRQQDTMSGIVENQKERARIEKVIAEGYDTPAMRAKAAGTVEQEARLDVKMAKDDPAYRARKKAEEAIPVEVATPSLKKATAEAEKAATDETEAEAARAAGEQTTTLKKIEENTSVLKDMASKLAVPVAAAGAAAESGGLGFGDMLGGGLKRAAGSVMKGARSIGSAMVRNPKMMGRLGAGLAIAGGAYTAYQGWTEAEDKKQEGLAEVDQAVAEGKITPVEASTIKAKVTDDANAAKGEASGEGTGMAVGGIAGMKIGATIGTMVGGPVGTIVGGAVGGAAGAIAGSSVGKAVGGSIVRGYQSVRNFFGGKASVDEAKPVEKASVTREYEVSGVSSDDIRNHPNYQKYYESALNGRTGPDAERMARKSAAMKVTADIAKARAQQPTNSAGQVAPSAAAPQVADTVYNKSGENAGAARKGPELGAAPVIVNAPTNVQNTSNFGPKSPPRNTDSSWQQYNRSKYAMSS